MKSLQNYIDIYRGIADGLNIGGDSAELLIQLLANASYISEVENIVYSQEASLERATLVNSKIQQCVELMYSVYRGQCPRIILNIESVKPLQFNVFDNIATLNNFKLYYLGYIDPDKYEVSENLKNYDYGFDKNTLSISAGKKCKILCLLANDKIVKTKSFKESDSPYFVEFLDEDISNDINVFLDGKNVNITRHFSDHILHENVFDLTIPGYGSRLYVMKDTSNIVVNKVTAEYFKLTKLSSYNSSELKKISLKGAELLPFEEDWIKERGITTDNHINTGILAFPEIEPDNDVNIHYRANQNRYINTIFRSNEDLGNLIKEDFPEKVKDTKAIYDDLVSDNNFIIYYIPNGNSILSSSDIDEFVKNRKSYYVIDNISILPGIKYNAVFDITVKLYEHDANNLVINTIREILSVYSEKFGINFINDSDNINVLDNSVLETVKALISKISNVKCIETFKIKYSDTNGNIFEEDYTDDFFLGMFNDLLYDKAYYLINCNISTVI